MESVERLALQQATQKQKLQAVLAALLLQERAQEKQQATSEQASQQKKSKQQDILRMLHHVEKISPEQLKLLIQKIQALQAKTKPAEQKKVYQADPCRIPDVNTLTTSDRKINVVVRLQQPTVVLLENVLSAEECAHLIAISRAKVTRATVIDDTTGGNVVNNARTANGTFLQRGGDSVIKRIENRIAQIMHCPVDHGEALQIIQYPVGCEYKPHHDYFSESLKQSDSPSIRMQASGQRVATLVMYLNDVEQGGETIFPEVRFAVKPKMGSAVYFEYCNQAGEVDPLSLHGGSPVLAGEKWIATKWVRQRTFK